MDALSPGIRTNPELSVVVPGLNEAPTLPELARRVHAALDGIRTYELIFVDDGSTDATWEVIGQLSRELPGIRGIRLRANFGKAMALSTGFAHARGEVVVTMDADLQDDPGDLPAFLAGIADGLDVVVGWRVQRLDPLNRRILSWIFNATAATLTGLRLHDLNCGFKAFRCEVLRSLPVHGDLFRFIAVLAKCQGFRVGEVRVTHRAREHGRSRYGSERLVAGALDLISVIFLTRYARKPMHLFGSFGLLLGLSGFAVCAYLTVLWTYGHPIGHRPLLLLGVLLIILGIQFFSVGLLGEFLTFSHLRRHAPEELPIREQVGDAQPVTARTV